MEPVFMFIKTDFGNFPAVDRLKHTRSEMEVLFTINGTVFQATPSKVPIDTSLNSFIRNYAKLSGTKFMCLEGGCGACIVTATGIHSVTQKHTSWAVNSV